MWCISIAKFILACEVVVQSQLPHTQLFLWRFHQATKKNIIQKCLSAQTNKFHFTCQKIYFSLLLWLIPPLLFFSFFFEFVIGERVYIHVDGQTLDGILLILWCNHTVHLMNCKSKMKWKIVIIQTFKCTCWQRIRQQKNQQRNFIFPNVIPHTDKSVLSFNSEGYDRDTHIEPQQCLLRIF